MKSIKKAAEEYKELVDASADWVEMNWFDFNTELKNAFIAGAKWVKKQEKQRKISKNENRKRGN